MQKNWWKTLASSLSSPSSSHQARTRINETVVEDVKHVKFPGNKSAKLVVVQKIVNPEVFLSSTTILTEEQKQVQKEHVPSFISKLLNDQFLGSEPPKVLISVTGSAARDYKMEPELEQIFRKGLINAAKSTTAWIVSGGTDVGVMQYVGAAKQKFITDVPTIGFATYNMINNKEVFKTPDTIVDYDPELHVESLLIDPKAPPNLNVNLNPNHTHFVLIESSVNSFAEEIVVRSDFEEHMYKKLGVPVCLIVVSGGFGTLQTVAEAADRDFAIVIIEGTGRIADAIAREVRQQRKLPFEHLESMDLNPAQRKQMDKILQKEKADNPILYSVDKGSFDLEILKAIQSCTQGLILQKLKLAVEWNRTDLAEHLLKNKEGVPQEEFSVALTKALEFALDLEKPDLFRVLTTKGARVANIDLRVLYTTEKGGFISREPLIDRFHPHHKNPNNFLVSRHSLVQHTSSLDDFMTEKEISFIQGIFRAVNPIFDNYIVGLCQKLRRRSASKGKHVDANSDTPLIMDSPPVPTPKALRVRFTDTMLWAILTGKLELAKVIWERAPLPVHSALIAAGLCRGVGKWLVNEQESFTKTADWFEGVAIELIEKLKYDNAKQLLVHKSPEFRIDALEIAVKTECKNFMSNHHVQRHLDEVLYSDKHGVIPPGTNMFQVILCIFFPFLLSLVYTTSDYTHYKDMRESKIKRGEWYHFYILPYTKFLTSTLCYMGYLALLSYVLVVDHPGEGTVEITYREILLWAWMFGYALEELNQLQKEKAQYFYHLSNQMDIFIILLQVGYIGLTIAAQKTGEPQYAIAALYILIIATVISYVRLLDVFTISSELGPLYNVLQKICWDVYKWVLVFMLFAIGFQVSFMALAPGTGQKLGSFYTILGDYQDTLSEVQSSFGAAVVSVYALIANIMLVNLLIAMMGDTFNKVRENSAKEWKFSRYELITLYASTSFHPPPFNIVIYPMKLFILWCRANKNRTFWVPKQPEQLRNLMKDTRDSYLEEVKLRETKTMASVGDSIADNFKALAGTQEAINARIDTLQQGIRSGWQDPTVLRQDSRRVLRQKESKKPLPHPAENAWQVVTKGVLSQSAEILNEQAQTGGKPLPDDVMSGLQQVHAEVNSLKHEQSEIRTALIQVQQDVKLAVQEFKNTFQEIKQLLDPAKHPSHVAAPIVAPVAAPAAAPTVVPVPALSVAAQPAEVDSVMFPMQNRSVPITWSAIVNKDLVGRVLKDYKPFKEWVENMNKPLNVTHLRVKEIHFQAVDLFGPRIGFVKFKANVVNAADMTVSGIVFMRGGAVGMLVILKLKEEGSADNGKEFVIVTLQPRVPVGEAQFAEIPAGMLDGGHFAGVAAKELREEAGIDIKEEDLVDLTDLAYKGVHQGMYPSAGGCDEYIRLFLYRTIVNREQLDSFQNKLTGDASEDEVICLKVLPLDQLWKEAPDAKALAALHLYHKLTTEGVINKEF